MPSASSLPTVLPLPLHHVLAVAGFANVYAPLHQHMANDALVQLTVWDITQPHDTFDAWLTHHQPDVLLLHAPTLKAVGIECAPLCQWLRQHPALLTSRPALVVHTDASTPAPHAGEAHEPTAVTHQKALLRSTALAQTSTSPHPSTPTASPDAMAWLVQGADDVVALPCSATAELRTRLLAHVRRQFEPQRHSVSQLPNATVLARVMSRALAPPVAQVTPAPWSLLWLRLSPWATYTHNTSQAACHQAIRVLKQACQPLLRAGEWLHQVDDATLAIMSPRHHGDKLARLICKQFDQTRAILHDADDLERGFMLCRLGGGLHRQPLLHVNVGVINSVETTATEPHQLHHQAQALVAQLSQQPSQRSRWLKHTLGLPAHIVDEECPPHLPKDPVPPMVWIAEPDAALAYLLSTTLGYQGLKVDAATDNAELVTWLNQVDNTLLPNVVLLDAVSNPVETVEACCKQLKRLAPCAQVVVATAQPWQHDALLGLGAHWLVSKPYDVLWLMGLLQRLSRG